MAAQGFKRIKMFLDAEGSVPPLASKTLERSVLTLPPDVLKEIPLSSDEDLYGPLLAMLQSRNQEIDGLTALCRVAANAAHYPPVMDAFVHRITTEALASSVANLHVLALSCLAMANIAASSKEAAENVRRSLTTQAADCIAYFSGLVLPAIEDGGNVSSTLVQKFIRRFCTSIATHMHA